MRLNKLNDSVLTVNYTVERERMKKKDGNSIYDGKKSRRRHRRENEYDLLYVGYARRPSEMEK